MIYEIKIKFHSEIESKVFIRILNKVKDDGVLSNLDFCSLVETVKDMDRIEE